MAPTLTASSGRQVATLVGSILLTDRRSAASRARPPSGSNGGPRAVLRLEGLLGMLPADQRKGVRILDRLDRKIDVEVGPVQVIRPGHLDVEDLADGRLLE